MKICVVSDSHGDMEILKKIYLANPNCDIYLHLGDSLLDEAYIYPFVSVKGNCDYFIDYPLFKIISTPYGNIYLEHGHIHGCGNEFIMKKYNAKVYLYGHTHIHKIEHINNYYYVNPGSTSFPRDGTNGTYLLMDCDENNIKFKFVEL